ncbi:MAG: hypothetical protein R3B70_13300 [Polyangiaceae bacterium]
MDAGATEAAEAAESAAESAAGGAASGGEGAGESAGAGTEAVPFAATGGPSPKKKKSRIKGNDKPAAIDLKSVVKRFGNLTAVNDVTFEVPDGCVFGLIGPNGAGKTT